MHCKRFIEAPVTRREMLRRCSAGFGAVALASLMNDGTFAGAAAAPPNPFAPRPPHFQPQAQRDLSLYGGWRFADRHVRSQAPADARKRAAVQDEKGADAVQRRRQHARQPVGIQAVWPKRNPRQLALPARCRVRGRACDYSVDDIRFFRTCRRELFPPHRLRPAGPPQRRKLDNLWPGECLPEPARLRRPQQRKNADWRPRLLQQRIPPRDLPGLALSQRKRSRGKRPPARSAPGNSGKQAPRNAQARPERPRPIRSRRRAGVGGGELRDGLPHAERRPRCGED